MLTLSVSMSQALNILFGHHNLSIPYLRKTTGTISYIIKIPIVTYVYSYMFRYNHSSRIETGTTIWPT